MLYFTMRTYMQALHIFPVPTFNSNEPNFNTTKCRLCINSSWPIHQTLGDAFAGVGVLRLLVDEL